MVGHYLKRSKKPLLIAGHGIRLAKAQEELSLVLEKGLPAVTTFNGFDLIPSDHPSFVGRVGTVGTLNGNEAVKKCDLLICVGTRNNIRQIGYNWQSFASHAEKIIVDIDDNELAKPTITGTIIRKDARKFLQELFTYELNISKEWIDELKSVDDGIALDPPNVFIRELTSELPEGAVVVCGNGTACVSMFQSGIVKRGQRIFWNSGCASMGYALPAAIGAHFACKKEVICITGDGSLQMNIQELQTVKHYNLPIKIFVLNNNGYRSIELTQANYFEGDFIGCNKESGVSFPDLEAIAKAYKIKFFNTSAQEVLSYSGPCICEINIGNDYKIRKFT